ncbi:unnamed protein product [Caenorhabditis auriculariae]|uniref:Activin types I and II receptor domain-containing protein n=1 Tax=Caenorhabditis auriculariae TaxID=2777116 RepID=A0A8S1GPT5_9PELO|nr:unnamed protein product [Caenorhabditis auriculariae]
MRLKTFLIAFSIALLAPVIHSLRCQCTTDRGGIRCYSNWCEVHNTTDKAAACAMVRIGGVQHFACIRVNHASPDSCRVDRKNGRLQTRCWCRAEDYCNVDLAERVEDGVDSDDYNDDDEDEYSSPSFAESVKKEDEMIIEQTYDSNDGNINLEKDFDEDDKDVKDFAKEKLPPMPVYERRKTSPGEEKNDIKPWRRENTHASEDSWRPPPPPPLPPAPKKALPTTTTTTTMTTTTTRNYEEEKRRYEEELQRRRQEYEHLKRQREEEERRHEEQRRRQEEERRRAQAQHESRRKFAEEKLSWPLPQSRSEQPKPKEESRVRSWPNIVRPPQSEKREEEVKQNEETPVKSWSSIVSPPEDRQEAPKTQENKPSSYKRPSQYRRPFDLNPSPISIENFNAIVFPPSTIRSRTSSTPTPTTTTTTTTASTTTSTTTTSTTTPRPSTTTSTTTTSTTTLPPTAEEPLTEIAHEGDYESDYYEEDVTETSTIQTTTMTARRVTTKSPRVPPSKLEEYKIMIKSTRAAGDIANSSCCDFFNMSMRPQSDIAQDVCERRAILLASGIALLSLRYSPQYWGYYGLYRSESNVNVNAVSQRSRNPQQHRPNCAATSP